MVTLNIQEEIFQRLVDSERGKLRKTVKAYSKRQKCHTNKEDITSSDVNIPFQKLFWFDEKNNVVRVNKTPVETNKFNKIPSTDLRNLISPIQNIFLPKRRLLFRDNKGK